MNLRKSLGVTIFAMAFFAAANVAASARDTRSVLLNHDATVGSSHLKSGDYDIKWETHSPEATITFMHGSKVMATAEGKVEQREKSYSANQVVYSDAGNGQRTIKEIRFRGSSEVIVFNE